QIVYGRTQSAFSEDGLPVGAGLEDLGKGLRSQVGTTYATLKKGPRYLELAEGYITKIAIDDKDPETKNHQNSLFHTPKRRNHRAIFRLL
ncbi:MAG: hypothetical protein IIX12_00335, partial [Alistipes sp.]|nr:hypothetical protein [Alistipes sp.]